MSIPSPDDVAPTPDFSLGQIPTVDHPRDSAPPLGKVPPVGLSTIDPLLGTAIGRYHLIKKLGEGGMGSVYLAEQSEPVKRQVALKLIKRGVDSHTIIARFEAERQALAVMDHPNIARIYDGGTTDGEENPTSKLRPDTRLGLPYFVMELVQGIPITDYCDQQRLSPRARLELFVPICQAVQHAHQKGIIHRDLKPSNVLVTEVDGKPVPKVIDFGVAKATEQPLTDQSMGDAGLIVGTPIYMSPEQADPHSKDIDTRTDIYALGVMLYELLTGSTPIDASQFRRGALLEVLRMVREVDPPRPSTKLSTAEGLPSIAANRNLEPKQLQSMLRNDIDWIVMKALEKDRSRRYETANGFAADVLRYLAGEVVLAHPPSRWYRVKKLVKRNKAQVLAAGLVLGALVVGLAGTIWGFMEAREEKKIAQDERDRKEIERSRAEEQKERAEKRLSQLDKGNTILTSIFSDLDVEKVEFRTTPLERILADRLVEAGNALVDENVGDPLIVAALRSRLAESLYKLGFSREAIPLYGKSLDARLRIVGHEDHETTVMQNNLAACYLAVGQHQKALDIFEKMLAQALPDRTETTLDAMSNRAECHRILGRNRLAAELMQEAYDLKKKVLGENHQSTLRCMSNLGVCHYEANGGTRGLEILLECRAKMNTILGIYHPATLSCINNLGYLCSAAGRHQESLQYYEEAFSQAKSKLGNDHPFTLLCMSNVSAELQSVGKNDRACDLMDEALRIEKVKFGEKHPSTLSTMHSMAVSQQMSGNMKKAVSLFRDVVARRAEYLGPEHPSTLNSMIGLASALARMQQYQEAIALLEKSISLQKKAIGPHHPDTLHTMEQLGAVLGEANQLDRAEPLLRDTLELMNQHMDPHHPSVIRAKGTLAACLWARGEKAKALPVLREVYQHHRERLGENNSETLHDQCWLAEGLRSNREFDESLKLYLDATTRLARMDFKHQEAATIIGNTCNLLEQLERYAEAEEWHRRWIEKVKATEGPQSAAYGSALSMLGLNYLSQKKWKSAEQVCSECLTLRQKLAPQAWNTFNATSMLGGALMGQDKLTEAEPLLLAGFEGMKKQRTSIPLSGINRLSEACNRLIELYERKKQPEMVMEYRKEFDKLDQQLPRGAVRVPQRP